MGRIFDALKRGEPRAGALPEPAVPCPPEPKPAETADLEDDASVPFIEVGGPRSEVAASPDVLAAVPAAPVPVQPPQVPAAAPEPSEDLAIHGTVALWCSWTLRPGVKAAG